MWLKSKAKKTVLEPDYVELEPVEWSNLLIGKFTANRALASFPLEGARDLPAGALEVVVITRSGERRCEVGEKDRARLFPQNR